MTQGISRRPAPRTGLPAHAAPRSRISISALSANLGAALSASPNGLVDARADAWGHGIQTIARAAHEAGAAGVVVDAAGAAALRGVVPDSFWRRVGNDTQAEERASMTVYGLHEPGRGAMTLLGHVLSLKPLLAGEGVSYGFTHHAPRDTIVALVTGGYAQGIVRSLGNVAEVLIAGVRCPIVGRVAMDVSVVDVGGAGVSPGDDVVFFGAGDPAGDPAGYPSGDPSGDVRDNRRVLPPTVADWARLTGLTAAELVTAVGLRTRREVVA